MRWDSRLHVLAPVLSAGDSLVRAAYRTRSGWTPQALCSSRSHPSAVSALRESLDVEISIDPIRQLQGGHADRYGLTSDQLEALAMAHEVGRFAVPRATDLDAVAAELGLSHQSLSERLRRAPGALTRSAIRERNYHEKGPS